MLLYNPSKNLFVDKVIHIFDNTFGKEVCLINKQIDFNHMGYFKLHYRYIPLEYSIVLESERNVFSIDIFDSDGAKNTLYRIEKFDNRTQLTNIRTALQKLKNVLEENDVCFYITREGNLYKKKGQLYKRVKDLTELI